MKTELKSKKEEMISNNYWSVFTVCPAFPEDYSDPHFFDVYRSTLKGTDYFKGSAFRYYLGFNSREELYTVFVDLLDHGYRHIVVKDPCDERGDDTFRLINPRYWFSNKEIQESGDIDCWYENQFQVESLPEIEIMVQYDELKRFFDYLESLKRLNFKSIRLKAGYQIGQYKPLYVIK